MSETAPSLSPSIPSPAPAKSSSRAFIEDLIVSGFGMASSAAVAYGSHFAAVNWQFAPFTWMADWVLPVGAIMCGFVAGVGYWIGARWFNHRPTRWLMLNILFVSVTTYFSIHYLDYTNLKVQGVPVERLMSFEKYLVTVTEHMQYEETNGRPGAGPVELGKWGWGVAALQVVGFSLGGFVVYGMLAAVPYCDRCSKYLSQTRTQKANWKEIGAMQQGYATVASLMQEGHLQEAIDRHAELGERRRFNVKASLSLELRKCPTCENRRLRLVGQRRNGRQWATIGQLNVPTEQALQMVSARR